MNDKLIENVLVENAGLIMDYTLFYGPTDRNGEGFGIRVKDQRTKETVTLRDISVNPVDSKRLFELVLCGFVTPVSLKDVVEDYIS